MPIATYIIVGVNVVMFAIEFFMGGTTDIYVLVALGAKVNQLIAAGQYWRLLTPIVLHSGVEHLLFNSMALLVWGQHAEALLGRARYLLVYVISGLCGSVLSFALSSSISVGASGAIFGFFGIFLYLWRTNRELFNRVFGVQVLIVIGINLFSGFTNPTIDNFGHIGGLIGGFLCAQCVGIRGERQRYSRRIVFGALLAAFLVLGFLWGLTRWAG